MRGSITKRGKNTYRIRIYLGRDADGKQRFHTATIHGKKEDAEAYATRKIHKIQFDGELPISRSATFKEPLDKWWAAKQASVCTSTRSQYEDELRRYVRPFFEKLRLGSITTDSLQEFYNRQHKEGWQPWLVRRVHMYVRSILDQAVRSRLIPFNPANSKEIKLPQVAKRNYVVFDQAAARAFAKLLATHPKGAFFLLAVESGLRPGELVALTWRDLNWQAGTLTVQRRVYFKRKEGWIFEERTKTPSSKRKIPLSPFALKALRDQLGRVTELRERVPGWQENDLIFPARSGWPQHSRNIGRLFFRPLLRAAGLNENMRVYDLRHTMATLLLDAAENIKVVQERLGHASAATTLEVYGHVLPGRQEQATTTIAEIFHGQALVNQDREAVEDAAASS